MSSKGTVTATVLAASIALVAAPVLAGRGAGAQTRVDVCGAIDADTTWSPANIYVITCEVTVASGATLTILPGTIVKAYYGNFTPDSITVFGQLVAEGTAAAPIVFTSIQDDVHGGDTNGDGSATVPAPGDWQSINFEAGSSGSISNALIAYGGKWYFYDNEALIRCFDADVRLDRVILRASYRAGLSARRCGIEFTNGTLADNFSGLDIHGLAAGMPFTLANNLFGPGPAGVVGFDGELHGPVSIRDNISLGGATGLNLRGTLREDLDWDNDELVLLLVEGLVVAPETTLRLAPGSVVKAILYDFGPGGLEVNGTLLAEGTPEAPIVFTSLSDDEYRGDTNGDGPSTGLAGQWSALTVNAGGRARIAHAEVLYGGGYTFFLSSRSLLRAVGGELILHDVSLGASAWNAIYADDGAVQVRDSRMQGNAWNVRNDTPRVVVDARHNWWGDPTGPYHATKNPGGHGKGVTDGVLFFPWAIDANGTVPSRVHVEGPTSISSGATVTYAVSYYAGEPLENVVLVVALPQFAEHVPSANGAVYWVERHQAFWRLGSLPAGGEGQLALRIRHAWGMPTGAEASTGAVLLADELPGPMEASPYLAYLPPSIEASTPLDAAAVEVERLAYPEFDRLLRQLDAEGYVIAAADRILLGTQKEIFQVLLVNRDRNGFAFVSEEGGQSVASAFSPQRFLLRDTAQNGIFDLATGTFTLDESDPQAGPRDGPAQAATFSGCLRNCVYENFTNYLNRKRQKLSNFPACQRWLWDGIQSDSLACVDGLRAASLSITALDHLGCTRACTADPRSHYCEGDVVQCMARDGEFGVGLWRYRCDLATGLIPGSPRFERCPPGDPCIENVGCYSSAAASGATLGKQSTRIGAAQDPNAKSGPGGDVVPGQEMTYTIECENVGEGTAYEVYVTDELSPHLDETTLDLHGQGEFAPLTRQIVWDIGELAPKGQEASKGERTFSVALKPDVPSGTVITNQAIVYFPSVPEQTPTNSIVNVVEPLAAGPQSLETPYGAPIGIMLSGRDVSGTPLTYAIDEPPLNGALTGAAPSLVYTPAENFTGQDRFAFTVSNGVSRSATADVTILVLPSAADTVAPELLWTYPENGAAIESVSPDPVGSDETGPIYEPSLLAGFSEAMDESTITAATVRLVAGDANGEVPASVRWDATSNQVVLIPRAAWQDGAYTATVTSGVRDANGNPLAADHSWKFRIGATARPCAGDCSPDGHVTIDELVAGVNIALGRAATSACPELDEDGNGAVSITELVTAVKNALDGCPRG
jgi:hypothetical protein